MARRLVILLVGLAIVGLAGFWFLTAPRSLAASDLPDRKPDLANGAYMFIAGRLRTATPPEGAKGDEQLKLGGGQVLDYALRQVQPKYLARQGARHRQLGASSTSSTP